MSMPSTDTTEHAGDSLTWLESDPSAPTTEAMNDIPMTPRDSGAHSSNEYLPTGVHPRDNSVPWSGNGPIDDQTSPINPDHLAGQGRTRRAPWSTENENAMSVFERASHDWSGISYTLTSTQPPIQLAGRQKGRKAVIIWVLATATEGILIAPNQGDLQQFQAVALNPGDSITLETEGPVWGYTQASQTTGSCNVIQLFNPPGGGLGLSSS